MGALSLLNFRDEIKLALGRDPGATLLTRWANYGLLDVASSVDLNKLDDVEVSATTAGIDSIVLTNSAEALVVKLVYDITNKYKLDWYPLADFYALDFDLDGAPKRWTRDRENILLQPVPDATYTMRVIIKNSPTRLSADGDQTEISQVWDQPILWFAMAHGFDAIGEQDRGQYFRQQAINYIQTRLSEEAFEEELSGLGQSLPHQEATS